MRFRTAIPRPTRSLSLALTVACGLLVPAGASAATGGAAAGGPVTGKGAGGVIFGTKPVPAKAAPKKTTVKSTARSVSPKSVKLGSRLPLKAGMAGSDVKALQQALVTVGESLDVDGGFGAATTQALTDWEQAAGIKPDGVVGNASEIKVLGQAVATAQATGTSTNTPPSSPATATIGVDGLAVAPLGAPAAVVSLIAAANAIATTPYVYGGGHKSFDDTAYDCSGSVSYALHGAGLLDYTMDSTMLESWGQPGIGQWVTVYANADHTFIVVAGIRFDTSGQKQAGGTRWQPLTTRSSYTGFVVRHPAGL